MLQSTVITDLGTELNHSSFVTVFSYPLFIFEHELPFLSFLSTNNPPIHPSIHNQSINQTTTSSPFTSPSSPPPSSAHRSSGYSHTASCPPRALRTPSAPPEPPRSHRTTPHFPPPPPHINPAPHRTKRPPPAACCSWSSGYRCCPARCSGRCGAGNTWSTASAPPPCYKIPPISGITLNCSISKRPDRWGVSKWSEPRLCGGPESNYVETKRQKRPAGFGSQQLQQLLVNLVDSRGDIAFGGIGGFLISREKHARHIALITVHRNPAVDENVLEG